MSEKGRQTPRKPATKFTHLRNENGKGFGPWWKISKKVVRQWEMTTGGNSSAPSATNWEEDLHLQT